MTNQLTLAVKWEVRIKKDGTRCIQLFDANGNKVDGKNARWEGNFYCSYNQLTSLEGCPTEIGGDFYCYNNQLTSLKGCPTEIGGNFYCSYNQLTSLKGCPTEIGGNFYCSYNQLTSLEGCPTEIGGGLHCYSNQLTSLKGCPTEIGGGLYCSYNQLELDEVMPKQNSEPVHARIEAARNKRGMTGLDGILAHIISQRGKVKRIRIVGSNKITYLVSDGDKHAYGDTLKQARESLIYKISSRDTSKYDSWTLDQTVTRAEAIEAYRVITGACESRTRAFCESHNLPAKIKVSEVIKLTQGQFGNKTFEEFFKR